MVEIYRKKQQLDQAPDVLGSVGTLLGGGLGLLLGGPAGAAAGASIGGGTGKATGSLVRRGGPDLGGVMAGTTGAIAGGNEFGAMKRRIGEFSNAIDASTNLSSGMQNPGFGAYRRRMGAY